MIHQFCAMLFLYKKRLRFRLVYHIDYRKRKMLPTGNRLFDEKWPKLLKYMETMFQFQSITRDDYMDFFRYSLI
jgi:hypothetical protein